MPIINRIADFHDDMTEWRQQLHRHPETAYEEFWTSDYIAERLESFGIEIHRGLAGTGVIGTLKGQSDNGKAIALRADMDALDIIEANDFAHKSLNPGKMHACGHDGHSTMLLGAAKYLSETRNFDGTVHFIFQPAEENEGGAKRMVEEGLFDKFPVDTVWGMHNWPGMPVGTFATKEGPMMAAYDNFDITIQGVGGHGAMPHLGVDPILVGSHIVTQLQAIPARNISAMDAVVISVTQFHGGDAYNVIPDKITLAGTVRTFNAAVQDEMGPRMKTIVDGVCSSFGASAEFVYRKGYPPTINSEDATRAASEVLSEMVGSDKVMRDPTPAMGSEDFSFMLLERPGTYIWIGNGPAKPEQQLHNPGYDFNDEVLPIGATYWSRLVETQLVREA
ncbi:MAG: amidohydrolase [Rhodospirillaceae bacterium]|nr:amidohydrolase [Rhodospirillaceae bacterium]MBT6136830.1 amidohydrolase [Rhodospirillaceae bacterium]